MELVVGVVLTVGRNPYGYKVYDTRSQETRVIQQLGENSVYNPEKRNSYIFYSDKGRVIENRTAKIVYLDGENVAMYTHKGGYERFKGNLTDPEVVIVNPASYTLYEVDDNELYCETDGIIDWDESAHVVSQDNDIISLGQGSEKVQRIPLISSAGKLTAVVVQSEDLDSVYTQACQEYRVCLELKQAGIASVRDLTLDTFDRLGDTYFCAKLNLAWTTLNLGRGLNIIGRCTLADGNFLLRCKSQLTFETESAVVQGSKYNNIYVVIDSKDEVKLSLTSYTDIEDFLDITLSLDCLDNYPEYKEVFTLLNAKHLESPRVDLLWTGAGISRKDGGMYLLTHVKELDKDYWLRLLAIHDYEEFVKWADYLESDQHAETYRDMVNGIEGLIKKKPDCESELLNVRIDPTKYTNTQYKFAI